MPGANLAPGAILPPVRKRHRGRIVAIALTVVGLVLVGVGGYALLKQSSTPPPGVTATTGTPAATVILNDPLKTNTNGWADDDKNCTFEQDGYHILGNYICYAPIGDLTNATIQVTATLRSGPMNFGYGLMLRQVSPGNHYEFLVDGIGHWVFVKCANHNCSKLVNWTANSAIHGGLNSPNTFKVVMQGSQFTLYINGTLVGSASDATYATGQVGLAGAAGSLADTQFANFIATKNGNS